MFLAKRTRVRQALTLGAAGTMVVSATLVAAGPAHAAETYISSGDTVTLAGHGFGHGHGMSQWGAYGAASVGKLSWPSIMAFYYPGTTLTNLGNPTIRVRLGSVSTGAVQVTNAVGLRLAGKALPGPATGISAYRARSLPAAGTVQVDALSPAGWKPYAPTASPAVFASSTGLVAVKLASGTSRQYRGSIHANRATPTSITAVSVLPMESYLRAVVPAEMPASWHTNAVRAQAVAARSYANYDRARTPATRAWDTCDSTSCQMYSGVPAENRLSDTAVAATAGWTMTYRGSAVFAQFGAASGGWTADGSQPYLTAKADPYDGSIANGANSWTKSITTTRIQGRWPSIGTYRQLRILTRDGGGQWGGRVLTASIVGSRGSVSVTGQTLRSAFGLQSEWFTPTNPGSAATYARDFSGDRKADVLAVVAGTGELRRYAGDGASGWASRSVIGRGFRGSLKLFTAGTWDADARPDVMAVRSDGSLWVHSGTAAGPLGSPRRIATGWGGYSYVFPAGDFDGDGLSDLIARRSDGTLILHSGNGLGGFRKAPRLIATGWGRFNVAVSPGDFNGDRKSDVIARTSEGLLYLYPGNGSGGWLQPRLIGRGFNVFSTITSAGDFNGDGKSDLFGQGRDGTLWLYAGSGTGALLARTAVGRGWNSLFVILP